MSNDITIETASGPMTTAEFDLPTGAKSAVIVVHEAFGLNNHIRRVAQEIADEEFYTLAPDFFHRAETKIAAYDDLDTALGIMASLTDEGILEDVDAAIQHLEGKGFEKEKIGIVGFCMGGRIAFLSAVSRQLGAAVSFYGGGIVTPNIDGTPALTPKAADLSCPWLGLFGELDQMIPLEGVGELKAAVESVESETEIVIYPGADHGFHCDERESFNSDASADAWSRTIAWFQTYL